MSRRRRPLPKHGTSARYYRGCRCRRCRAAVAAYMRAWRLRRGLATNPRPVARCGTWSGYQRHRRLGQPTCAKCRAAVAAYKRERRAVVTVKAIATDENVLAWIREMALASRPPTLSELEAATGIARPELERILRSLLHRGVIRRTERGIEIATNVVPFPTSKGEESRHPSDGPEIRIDVVGEPVAVGSTRPDMQGSAAERIAIWRAAVATAAAARAQRIGWRPLEGPVWMGVTFRVKQPQRPAYPVPAVRPDGDKLLRPLCDALTDARIYNDDGQITDYIVRLRYARKRAPTGASIVIRSWDPNRHGVD